MFIHVCMYFIHINTMTLLYMWFVYIHSSALHYGHHTATTKPTFASTTPASFPPHQPALITPIHHRPLPSLVQAEASLPVQSSPSFPFKLKPDRSRNINRASSSRLIGKQLWHLGFSADTASDRGEIGWMHAALIGKLPPLAYFSLFVVWPGRLRWPLGW